MADIFKSLKKKASLSRNGFDLSQRHIFSGKAGQLLPVFTLDCLPNDYHKINLMSLVRTLPLKTDAFTRMRVRFCFGFVPYWQNWHQWNEFILQTQESFSDNENQNLPSFTPNVSLPGVLQEVAKDAFDYSKLVRDHEPYASEIPYRDDFGFLFYENALRLLDLLGYGSYYHISARAYAAGQLSGEAAEVAAQQVYDYIAETYGGVRVNVWKVLAYHKFYNDYFRNQNYELSNPYMFNVDSVKGITVVTSEIDPELVYTMFKYVRYAQYAKDKFTSLFSSPQFGSVSTVSLSDLDIKNAGFVGTSNGSVVVKKNNSNTNPSSLIVSEHESATVGKWSIADAFDVYDLRKAEMFQRWKEDKLRAGNKTKDQATAMWGQPFKYAQDNYCQFVDEIDVNLNIDEVLNTAASANYDLGEIGGKAIGVSNDTVTFKTDDFGTLLCVAIVEPISEYNAFMLDKCNTLIEPFDYATPHFENLGFEGVSQFELAMPFTSTNLHNYITKQLGYGPRFMNYKTAVDKVHGEFEGKGHSSNGESSGSLAPWSVPRTDLQYVSLPSAVGINWNYFKISPRILNSTFYGEAGDGQDSDQFIFNCNFDVKSVRSLSVLGLPQW